jgi:hypothetical protein
MSGAKILIGMVFGPLILQLLVIGGEALKEWAGNMKAKS